MRDHGGGAGATPVIVQYASVVPVFFLFCSGSSILSGFEPLWCCHGGVKWNVTRAPYSIIGCIRPQVRYNKGIFHSSDDFCSSKSVSHLIEFVGIAPFCCWRVLSVPIKSCKV